MTSRASVGAARRARGRGGRGPCRAAPDRRRRGSSTVLTISLPMATPCSFTPCSAPHNQVGRDNTWPPAPVSGSSRYWVCNRPPAGRRPWRSTTWASLTGRSEFLANSVPRSPRSTEVSHTTGGAAAACYAVPGGGRAQAAPLSGCQRGQVVETGVVGEDLDDRGPEARGASGCARRRGSRSTARGWRPRPSPRRGPCGPSGGGTPCGPRAGRSGRRRRRRRCRGPVPPRRWPRARAGARR